MKIDQQQLDMMRRSRGELIDFIDENEHDAKKVRCLFY